MYGGDHFNPHLLLRYGYTLDFFQCYSPLQYRGIELPLPMIRLYHLFIRDFVDKKISNPDYLVKKQKQWGIHSMQDVQTRLQRMPKQQKNLALDPGRNAILLCGNYVDFALEHLTEYNVILLSDRLYERRALYRKVLPPHFHVYPLYKVLLDDIHSSGLRKRTQELVEQMKNLHAKRLKKRGKHEIFARSRFSEWMKEQLPSMIHLVDVLYRLIHDFPIKVIIQHTDILPRECILALFARRLGLPFWHIQHHLSTDASIVPTRATHYIVWGRHMKNWLVTRGIHPGDIYELGSLRLQYSQKKVTRTRQDLLANYHWKEERFLVTYTTEQYPATINYAVMEWLKKAVSQLPIFVVIKTHPDDRLSYDAYLSDYIALAPPDFHLYEILQATDFITTISSTTAVEGAIVNRGTIVLQPPIPYDYHLNYNNYTGHLAEAQAGIVVYSPEELVIHLQKLIHEESYHNFLVKRSQEFLNSTLTPSTKKTSEQLARMLQQNYFSSGEGHAP